MATCFSLKLDGVQLSPQMVESFKVTISMKYLLPIGELIMNDKGGSFLASLRARVGSIVTVALTDYMASSDWQEPSLDTVAPSKTKPIQMTPLIVCDIKGDNSSGQESMGGKVVLSLAHPWAIFKDFSNHAYPPTALSNLVTQVVSSKVRGYDIPLGKIDQTDDTAGTPRYKCGLSDDEFIQTILLPFMVSSANPMYSFIDDLGKYNLRTFESIYLEEPKVAYVPNMMSWMKVCDAYMKKNPSIENTANYDKVTLGIGGRDIRSVLGSLSPKVFFEDTLSGSIKSGILRKSFKVNKSNFLPVNRTLMDLGPISAGYMYQFRTMEDAVALMYGSTRDLNELISLSVSSTFLGTAVSVGTTANLCVLASDTDNPSVMHWLTGKFAVIEKTYFSEGELLEAKALTTLAKPVVETTNSAIGDQSTLYQGYSE